MTERDCPHGHKLGKCDTCELILAEARIADLEAELTELTAELNRALALGNLEETE